jgi:alpha-1,2-mannosyltransferase
VPPDAPVTGAAPDFDRHFRRAVWITALVAVVIAAVVYADKAADDRSAFIRWRPQVLQFWRGVNIYDKMMFPNPPIMPITLYPLMSLPPLQGAMAWYALKVTLTALSVWLCFRMVRPDDRVLPSWVQGAVLLMSFRTVLSDLHHGNNNLIILFLVVACLAAWRKGYDVLAGMVLALAISYKVTPALFVLYFAYKRSWRTVGATLLGMGVFLLIVPGVVVGPSFNGECLAAWWRRILSPYLDKGVISQQEINQSMVGVLTRLLTNSRTGTGRYDVHLDVNLVSWPPRVVGLLMKGVSVGMVGLLAWLCRTKTDRRDDNRLFGEFALVVLTMLFVSERSWKHHFVTLLLPYTYLTYRVGVSAIRPRVKAALASAMVLSALMMATTSSELGGLFARNQGHKIAQGYGMFLWSAVVVYVATAWMVRREGRAEPAEALPGLPQPETSRRSFPPPHFSAPAQPGTIRV